MGKKRQGRTRGGRTRIAQMGAEADARMNSKWHHKMQRDHPAEYAEAMRRIAEAEKRK